MKFNLSGLTDQDRDYVSAIIALQSTAKKQGIGLHYTIESAAARLHMTATQVDSELCLTLLYSLVRFFTYCEITVYDDGGNLITSDSLDRTEAEAILSEYGFKIEWSVQVKDYQED